MQAYTELNAFDEFDLAKAHFDDFIARLSSQKSQLQDLSAIETTIQSEGMELLRLVLQGYLDLRSKNERKQDSVMSVDGIELTHCRPDQKRNLMTLFGEVKVNRLGYRAKESRIYFPMDEEMNLPKGKYSPLLRERLAKEVAKGSFDDAIESIKANTGGKVPKRQAEILSRIVSQDFEEFYAHKPLIKSKDLLGNGHKITLTSSLLILALLKHACAQNVKVISCPFLCIQVALD